MTDTPKYDPEMREQDSFRRADDLFWEAQACFARGDRAGFTAAHQAWQDAADNYRELRAMHRQDLLCDEMVRIRRQSVTGHLN